MLTWENAPNMHVRSWADGSSEAPVGRPPLPRVLDVPGVQAHPQPLTATSLSPVGVFVADATQTLAVEEALGSALV
jgi:hypothetical protein